MSRNAVTAGRSGSLSTEESSSGSSSGSSEEEGGGRKMRSAVLVKRNERKRRSYSPRHTPPSSPPNPPKRYRQARPGRREEREEEEEEGEVKRKEEEIKKKKKEDVDPILTRTGGAYIPPARLRMLQAQYTDKTSIGYQRLAWEALKKSINGFINKVNVSNISNIVRELFQENVIRGRGLLARSLLQAQAASPTFTHVYAALVAIINTKFPHMGELISKRLILQFRKGFQRNNKVQCLSSSRFLAHLVNQQVVHEILALEILTLLLDNPTDDSVEVAVGFLKECGMKLGELTPRGLHGVFESLRGILHQGQIDKRVQYMIEVMYAIRKDGFKEHPAVLEELDKVDEDDQFTHLLSLEDEVDPEDTLNVFKHDPDYVQNEEKYNAIKTEILGPVSSDSSGGEGESGDDSEEGSDDEGEEGGEGEDGGMMIQDETQTNLLSLRRTIYLTIMSSLDYEECAHKMLKMELKPGQDQEVANMLIECCSQERSYQKFYGLLGQRFCLLNESWVQCFDGTFQQQYATVHRLETNKLRNVAKFFAQLFYSDALPWTSMSCIHLNEEETNSSSRIFVKILYQELSEYMGLPKLNERLRDPFLSSSFEGLLPRDNPKNTRFAINFFTSIGLGGLTDDLREHLRNAPKMILAQQQDVLSSSDSSSDQSESDSDSSSESSSESSSSSDDDRRRKKKKRIKATPSPSPPPSRKKEPSRTRSKQRPSRSSPKATPQQQEPKRTRARVDRSRSRSRSPGDRRMIGRKKHSPDDAGDREERGRERERERERGSRRHSPHSRHHNESRDRKRSPSPGETKRSHRRP